VAAKIKSDIEDANSQQSTIGQPRSRLRQWISQFDMIALSALVLSLMMAVINAYYFLRHAEIVVEPPSQILLYIDGDVEKNEGSLVAAVQLPMINTAGSDHGDLLTNASLELSTGQHFAMESIIEPTFVNNDQKTDCELGFRCVRTGQLFVKQDYNAVFDLPGGLASARFINFPIHNFNCTESASATKQDNGQGCEALSGLRAGLGGFPTKRKPITIHVEFVGDGQREISCDIEAMTNELREAALASGWLVLNCENGEVTGAPWL